VKTVISITEARKRLPGIIKSLKAAPDTVYQITVHDVVVAEIRTPPVMIPGEAAAKLLRLRKKFGKRRQSAGAKPLSESIKEYMYVHEEHR
jgi:hypothetical protein